MQRALSKSFSYNANILRSASPLSDDQIRRVAPSIFAVEKHVSRSEKYTYIPTISVLEGLRKEGFQPFAVAQSRSRIEGKGDFTKHCLRLRHPSQIAAAEANEIILINSHDGTSAYQMLAGMFRFVCFNGMVCGDTISDIRVPHKGQVVDRVIAGAYDVLDGFTRVVEERDSMKALNLSRPEQLVFAHAALELKYDTSEGVKAPIVESQLLEARRFADRAPDLWTTFNRVQENLIQGGLPGRSATGRNTRTRPVAAIDQNVRLNRALWVLANEMRALREGTAPSPATAWAELANA